MSDPMAAFPPHAIAIVGMAGRFPGAQDLDEFWHNIWNGVETLETFSDADLDAAGAGSRMRSDPNFVRKGTVLETAELFDAGFFGFTPREAQILDPQHRVFLECAWEALEHAGYAPGMLADKAVGVYGGSGTNSYLFANILRDRSLIDSVGGYQIMLANEADFLCTRVSYKLDLRGPSMTVQTACSTSLVAVHTACKALQGGECDMALAGGVSINFPQRAGYLYEEGGVLSPDGRCRPFDAAAAGMRTGPGAGIAVLKRLRDALASRDTVHAVITGTAITNDGAGKAGYTAPSIDGQAEAIAPAQALAGVDTRTVTYMEAHGSATPLGDPIEIAALTQVFRASASGTGFCSLGSLKASIGSLDAAGGVAILIKTVLALKHRQIPPLVNFRSPNPQLDLERSPFTASANGSAWASTAGPRRAGVNSYGVGGTNVHVVLEEAPQPAIQEDEPAAGQLLVLSAKTATALDLAAANLAGYLERHPGISLGDAAWTLQAGRQPFAHRRALAVADAVQAVALLRQPGHASILNGVNRGAPRPAAFLFGGEGSLHPGMGAGLYRTEPHYREAIGRCAPLLQHHLGVDIRDILFAGPEDSAIHEARFAGPALFCTGYALASLWMALGVAPAAMLGHGAGEYVAAHLASVFSLSDALAVVAARGRSMQDLPPGAMAGPALQPFTAILEGISLAPPQIPYISNATGGWITASEATSPGYYATRLHQPLPLERGIRTLASDPALFLLEAGPGDELAAMAQATLGKERSPHIASSLPQHGQDADSMSMLDAIGRLWVSGVPVAWEELHAGAAPRRIPLPSYPFERKLYTVEAAPGERARTAIPAGAGEDAFAPFQSPSRERIAVSSIAEIEQHLAAIWTELTGIETIGVHENFFDLGGHSLLATRVIARIEARLGMRVTLRDIFEAPTISGLAARIGTPGVPAAYAGEDREEFII